MNNNDNKAKIINVHPDFITGLTDAEGSFSITKGKNSKAKYNMNVGLSFRIKMLSNEIELLNMVKDYFGCGHLSAEDKVGAVTFGIQDINSINNIIIPHFSNYPLRGTKYLDFLSFKKALDIINSKKHLTKEGLDEVVKISFSMNSYRKFTENYSPSHTNVKNIDYIPVSGHYINGFIAGDGCLTLHTKSNVGFAKMSIKISQHINNTLLLHSILAYFKSNSKVYHNPSGLESEKIIISGHRLWKNTVFNHFNKYPLYGTKKIRLNKLFAIKELMLNDNHLIRVNNHREWKPEIKLRVLDIWNS